MRAEAEAAPRNPTRGTFLACCASAGKQSAKSMALSVKPTSFFLMSFPQCNALRFERLELFERLEPMQVQRAGSCVLKSAMLFEEDLTKLLDVLGVSVAPTRVGGVEFGSFF